MLMRMNGWLSHLIKPLFKAVKARRNRLNKVRKIQRKDDSFKVARGVWQRAGAFDSLVTQGEI
jgi:hypothetical protein